MGASQQLPRRRNGSFPEASQEQERELPSSGQEEEREGGPRARARRLSGVVAGWPRAAVHAFGEQVKWVARRRHAHVFGK